MVAASGVMAAASTSADEEDEEDEEDEPVELLELLADPDPTVAPWSTLPPP